MKKWLVIALLFVSFLRPVHADVLIEPWGDEFYIDHQDEMIVEYHKYLTTSEVQIMESPVSDNVNGTVEAGRIIRVEFLYTDEQGTLWGMQVLKNDKGAWFKMDSLSKMKEHEDFIQEHPELTELEKTISFEEDGWLTLWEYPGSEIISSSMEASSTRNESYPLKYTYEYLDEEGNLWIYVPYFEHSSGWINTSESLKDDNPFNPYSAKITQDDLSTPTPTPITTSVPEVQTPVEDGSLDEFIEENHQEGLIGGLVMIVCGLTGVLAVIQYRRKKDSHE